MPRDYGTRLRPDEVTVNLRHQIARATYRREKASIAFILLAGIVMGLGASLTYRWRNQPFGSELELVGPILIFTAIVMVGVHYWYEQERRFIQSAHVTSAEVQEMREAHDFTHLHEMVLRYSPTGSEESPASEPKPNNLVQFASVRSRSPRPAFDRDLHEGDKVSVLYDPEHPGHAELVELDHDSS